MEHWRIKLDAWTAPIQGKRKALDAVFVDFFGSLEGAKEKANQVWKNNFPNMEKAIYIYPGDGTFFDYVHKADNHKKFEREFIPTPKPLYAPR